MGVSTGILFGIISMFFWGFVDFFIAIVARKSGIFKTFFWTQIVEVAIYLGAFFAFFKMPAISLRDAGIISLVGFLSVISWLAFYKSLQIGKVAIATPLSSAWPVVTVILSIAFLGEKLSQAEVLGVALAILGTVLVSFRMKDLLTLDMKNPAEGVRPALLSALCWGINFVFIALLVAKLGWFIPLFLTKVAGVAYLAAYSSISGKNASFPKKIALLIAAIGVLEVAGFLSYGFGLTSEYTSIMAPIIASSPIITIFLARIFFRETLEINQKIGVVSVLMGLVLLAM